MHILNTWFRLQFPLWINYLTDEYLEASFSQSKDYHLCLLDTSVFRCLKFLSISYNLSLHASSLKGKGLDEFSKRVIFKFQPYNISVIKWIPSYYVWHLILLGKALFFVFSCISIIDVASLYTYIADYKHICLICHESFQYMFCQYSQGLVKLQHASSPYSLM